MAWTVSLCMVSLFVGPTYRSAVDSLATQGSIRRAHNKRGFQLGVKVLATSPC